MAFRYGQRAKFYDLRRDPADAGAPDHRSLNFRHLDFRSSTRIRWPERFGLNRGMSAAYSARSGSAAPTSRPITDNPTIGDNAFRSRARDLDPSEVSKVD